MSELPSTVEPKNAKKPKKKPAVDQTKVADALPVDQNPVEQVDEPPKALTIQAAKATPIFQKTILLNLPVAETTEYKRRRLRMDMRDMTKKQRRGLNLLMEGFQCSGHRIESGHEVNSQPMAIRAMLELIADVAGE